MGHFPGMRGVVIQRAIVTGVRVQVLVVQSVVQL